MTELTDPTGHAGELHLRLVEIAGFDALHVASGSDALLDSVLAAKRG